MMARRKVVGYLVEGEDDEDLAGQVAVDVGPAPGAGAHQHHDVPVAQASRHGHLLQGRVLVLGRVTHDSLQGELLARLRVLH